MPTDSSSDSNPVPLEDLLAAFQKSLARSNEASLDVRKRDLDYLKGQRALYVVDSLQIDLKGAISAPLDQSGNSSQIMIDLKGDPNYLSSVKFSVESSPLEPVQGAKILLTRTRPVAQTPGENHFTSWVINEDGNASRESVNIVFEHASGKPQKRVVTVKTDVLGKVEFIVDGRTGALSLVDQQLEKAVKLNTKQDWVVSVQALGMSSSALPFYFD